MIIWQKKQLSDNSDIGEPGALPLDLRGLADADLADLVWTPEELGYRGFGFLPIVDLTDVRAEAVARVNRGAGAFRLRYITDIPGQQATYLSKEAEAKAWEPEADPADFPYLASEAAATGVTIDALAEVVRDTAALWRGLDKQVEGLRKGAAAAIASAETAEEVAAAANVDWDAVQP